MINKYLKCFPYEEKGFETIIDDDPLNIIYSRDYLYVSQNIFIITLPDEFIVEVDINCSYRLKYEFEKKIPKKSLSINDAAAEANTFIDEKLSLVDENFHLHHITGYVNSIIYNEHKRLYQEMKNQYSFNEPQNVLNEISRIYEDYNDNYIDFIKYASACYIVHLLSEGLKIQEINNRKELIVGLPCCELIYPSIEMDKIFRKEKDIDALKINGFNKTPWREQRDFSTILFNRNEMHLEELKTKYKFEIVSENDRWIAVNMPIKNSYITTIEKICKKSDKPVIALYCYASFTCVIKIFDVKVISIYLESNEGLLKNSYLPTENENIEEISKYLVAPYTFADLLQVISVKKEYIEDVAFEVLKMIGIDESMYEKFGIVFN